MATQSEIVTIGEINKPDMLYRRKDGTTWLKLNATCHVPAYWAKNGALLGNGVADYFDPSEQVELIPEPK